MQQSDTELIQHIQAQDAVAFEQFFARHQTPIQRHLWRIVRDDAICDDLVQARLHDDAVQRMKSVRPVRMIDAAAQPPTAKSTRCWMWKAGCLWDCQCKRSEYDFRFQIYDLRVSTR